ncbi:MAG: hypothetical protein IJ519_02080, partial [Clostridia bacterium]|nr:hypothetical protein [Clostridia bacterium]
PVVDPRYTNCPPAPPAPVEPRLGKGKYMWKKAPGGIKATGIVGALVGIACIVICVAMFAQFIFGSILDYPIIELTDADLEFDEDTFKTEVDRIGLELDRLEAELEAVTDSEEKKQLEKTIDYTDRLLCELEYFADTPSIYNSYMIALVLEEVGDELEDEIEFDGETMEDVMQGAENILLVFGGYGLFILLLTLLAVIFRNNFFTVPALVLGFAFPFLFSGMIYGVLFVVCYVAFFILNIVINSNYRKYKREYKKAVA